jgi:hypothetical protein
MNKEYLILNKYYTEAIMPKMVPPYINTRIENYGESLVFDLLKNAPGTEDWIILHSYNLPSIATSLGREIDFLALIPNKGIFIFEVKSGEVIKRTDGSWEITGISGKSYVSEEGPFKQALNAMFSLKNNLKKWLGEHNKYSNMLFSYGVIFPEAVFHYSDMEIEKWRVCDSNTICGIQDYFDILFENSLKTYKNYSSFNESESLPSKKEVDELFRKLRGSFEFNETFNEKGQDLINDSYLEVIENLLDGGLKNGEWDIFCDFERQNIFNEQLSSSQMLSLLKSKASFATYKLTVNCRNTREIADEIKEISGFNYKKYLNQELSGISVEYIYYENEDDEIIKHS